MGLTGDVHIEEKKSASYFDRIFYIGLQGKNTDEEHFTIVDLIYTEYDGSGLQTLYESLITEVLRTSFLYLTLTELIQVGGIAIPQTGFW